MPEILTDTKIEFNSTAKILFNIGKIGLAMRFPVTILPLRE